MTELINFIFGRNFNEWETTKRDFYKSAVPKAAAVGEAYLNPMSMLRNLSAPAKQDLAAAFRKAMKRGGRTTSAIDMAYGKRRNYRAKRSYRPRAKGRKRAPKRRRAARKGNASSSTLNAIKKALSGHLTY